MADKRPYRISRRLCLVALALSLWCVVMALLSGFQRRLFFPGQFQEASPEAGEDIPGLERWWHDGGQGPVEAWFLPGQQVSAHRPGPAVIFAHGNAELIDDWPGQLEHYGRLGVSVLLPEYRGYGRSAGAPSQKNITKDFIAFYDRLVARPDVDGQRIIYHGRSLGGGVLCALALSRPPAALILMSTFTSLVDVVRDNVPLPSWLISDPFDNMATLRSYQGPALIIHGRHDELIAPAQAERNAATLGTQVIWHDAGHNDWLEHWPSAQREIESFLRHEGVLH
jgi:pimeloyl-ACP methyl ester carboxylesterase